jgi:hypothetical protein
VPSGFWLLMATAICSGVRRQQLDVAEAIRERHLLGLGQVLSREHQHRVRWNASSTVFQVAASIRASARSVTTAPSVAAIGVTFGSMGLHLAMQDRCRPGRSQGRAMTHAAAK